VELLGVADRAVHLEPRARGEVRRVRAGDLGGRDADITERGLSLRSPGRFCAAADRLVSLYGDRPDPASADGVVDAWIKAQAYRLYTWGTVTRLAAGGDMGAAGSVNKVFWSELDIALHETALDLLGPEAEVESRWLDGYTFSLSGPIYAGTNEIQRNIVAERILGLPREPKGATK
ncbi:acyl-CoA dehydrogenase family protein, partial [Nocardioides hankookensis]